MITAQQLKKRFGKLQVLDGIDLHIKPKRIVAILGPNGSGKTTLLKVILGMVIPDSGQLLINDQDITNQWAYRSTIGYLPQLAQFPENLTVRELIDLIRGIRQEGSNEQELISRFKLTNQLSKRLGTLSGGTRQKVNIVLALMFDVPILILDEPTAGLDPVALLHLKILIRELHAQGKTILITTHIMSLVEELAEDVIFLLEGQVYFQGTLEEIKQQTHQESLELAVAQIVRQ